MSSNRWNICIDVFLIGMITILLFWWLWDSPSYSEVFFWWVFGMQEVQQKAAKEYSSSRDVCLDLFALFFTVAQRYKNEVPKPHQSLRHSPTHNPLGVCWLNDTPVYLKGWDPIGNCHKLYPFATDLGVAVSSQRVKYRTICSHSVFMQVINMCWKRVCTVWLGLCRKWEGFHGDGMHLCYWKNTPGTSLPGNFSQFRTWRHQQSF